MVKDGKRIFWHRELPPLAAGIMAEHTIEAESSRVAGTLAYRGELWTRCYDDLMNTTERRLSQEMARLGGDYAHILEEFISPKHDAGTGQSWLRGRFKYVLYRSLESRP